MKLYKIVGFTGVIINNMLVASAEESQTAESSICGSAPRPMHITARHIEPNGIGYRQGYTTLEGFFTYNQWDNWLLFLDARGHIFNNGRPAANAGIGTRYLTDKRIWGINSYYDYRNTTRQHYNQVGVGLESLGQIWDFRLNGYFPVGTHKSRNYDLRFVKFNGNESILSQKYEYVLGGFNGEAAIHVDTWEKFPLYFAAGPYYLHGKGVGTWGGQARASVKIYEYLELSGNVSYDHLFKWIGQGQLSVTAPFGHKKKVKMRKNSNASCSELIAVSKRAYQSVDRFEIIPVDRKHKYSVALNADTGLPFHFVFVDNTSASLGTYESPYPTLAEAEANSSPNDIIYVFPGDGTTKGVDTGITLSDYQKLWGSGYAQTLATTLGKATMPVMSSSTFNGVTITPIITNTSGPVVTLANGNEISGLFLQNQGSNPSISATDISNATILNSTLAGGNAAGYIGIDAVGLSGTLTVSDCTFNQGTYGILLNNSSGSLSTAITNSTFSSGSILNPTIFWTLSNAAQGNLTLEDSSIVTSYRGVEVNLTNTSAITAQVNNNTFDTGNRGFYIDSLSGDTTIDVSMQYNTINSYVQSVYIVQTGSATATLSNNQLFAASSPTFEIDSNGTSSSATVTLSNNTLYSQDNYCVFLNQSAGTVTASITDNTMSGFDFGTGVYSFVGTSAVSHTLNVTGNTINVGDNGVYIEQSVGAVNATISNNSIASLYDEVPIYLQSTAGAANSTLTINDNTYTGYYGIYISQDNSSNLTIAANNNTTVSEYPFYLQMTSGSADFSLTNNTFTGYLPVTLIQGGNCQWNN